MIAMQGWSRGMWFDETGLPWVPPSPNMPTLETAAVYPGTCLLEGTNVSEGRGTARPFETFGAPWIDPEALKTALLDYGLPGVGFSEARFTPTASKFQGNRCAGLQVDVTDREAFRPVLTGVAVISALRGCTRMSSPSGLPMLRAGVSSIYWPARPLFARRSSAGFLPGRSLRPGNPAWPAYERPRAREIKIISASLRPELVGRFPSYTAIARSVPERLLARLARNCCVRRLTYVWAWGGSYLSPQPLTPITQEQEA